MTAARYQDIETMQSQAASTIVAEVNEDTVDYGGIWYDWNTNEYVIQYVGPQPLLADNSLGFPVRYERVTHSRADLDSALESVTTRLMASGTSVPLEGSIDTTNNRVSVEAQQPALAAALLGDNPLVDIVSTPGISIGDSCPSLRNCTPFRGGINIEKSGDPLTGECSFGYYGRDSNHVLSAVTAGHCGPVWAYWYAGTSFNYLGQSNWNQIGCPGACVDGQRIAIQGAMATSPFNTIRHSDSDVARPITTYYGWNEMYVGQAIRVTGFNGGTTTGTVSKLRGLLIWSGGADWVYDFSGSATYGDSGGTVWGAVGSTAAILLGIYQGENTSTGVHHFTQQHDIKGSLDVQPCVTASC